MGPHREAINCHRGTISICHWDREAMGDPSPEFNREAIIRCIGADHHVMVGGEVIIPVA